MCALDLQAGGPSCLLLHLLRPECGSSSRSRSHLQGVDGLTLSLYSGLDVCFQLWLQVSVQTSASGVGGKGQENMSISPGSHHPPFSPTKYFLLQSVGGIP